MAESQSLYRDPIFDGASDPTVIWNREEKCWWMLYTQRRSTEINIGVSSVHGSDIGVASSPDGTRWLYRGTLPGLDIEHGRNTFWAPEVIYARDLYHMYVSYIRGVPEDWNRPRNILHYTASNLWEFSFDSVLALSSDRVIDACVCPADGGYKLWYKDEAHDSHTYAAASSDLFHWKVTGPEITDVPHEGPNVFELKGSKWMITDCWKGLAVYRSDDFRHWGRRGMILDKPGKRPADAGFGHHADVLVQDDEAVIFYFVQPNYPEGDPAQPPTRECTYVQAARLTSDGENLFCDRDEDFCPRLQAPVGS